MSTADRTTPAQEEILAIGRRIVAELPRSSSRLQESLAERGDAGLALGGAEAEQQVDTTGRVDTDSLSR